MDLTCNWIDVEVVYLVEEDEMGSELGVSIGDGDFESEVEM